MGFIKLFWWLKTQIIYRIFLSKLGIKTYIGSIMFLYGGRNIKIGNRVRVFPGCRMECHKKGQIIISNDVAIGQNFHVTSGGGLNLLIGQRTTILGNVFITNIDHEYRNIGQHVLKQPHIYKKTIIGENSFIGFGAAIKAGSILGKNCIVGANSVVTGKFPDYCVIVGAPARIVKRYNTKTMIWEKTNPDGTFLK